MHPDVGQIYSSPHSFVLTLQPFMLAERQGISQNWAQKGFHIIARHASHDLHPKKLVLCHVTMDTPVTLVTSGKPRS
jgi:hypothetical protein